MASFRFSSVRSAERVCKIQPTVGWEGSRRNVELIRWEPLGHESGPSLQMAGWTTYLAVGRDSCPCPAYGRNAKENYYFPVTIFLIYGDASSTLLQLATMRCLTLRTSAQTLPATEPQHHPDNTPNHIFPTAPEVHCSACCNNR